MKPKTWDTVLITADIIDVYLNNYFSTTVFLATEGCVAKVLPIADYQAWWNSITDHFPGDADLDAVTREEAFFVQLVSTVEHEEPRYGLCKVGQRLVVFPGQFKLLGGMTP